MKYYFDVHELLILQLFYPHNLFHFLLQLLLIQHISLMLPLYLLKLFLIFLQSLTGVPAMRESRIPSPPRSKKKLTKNTR